jgi:hypothetical protein
MIRKNYLCYDILRIYFVNLLLLKLNYMIHKLLV